MMATANETGRCSGTVAGIDVAKARVRGGDILDRVGGYGSIQVGGRIVR